MHRAVEPKILYFGTPVVLISTLNEDGSPNLAPMSSAWWLGWSCMLGMSTRSKTVNNLRRKGECVLNLPSADLVDVVDRLALTTGSNPVPEYKQKMSYRYEPNKFEIAGVTPIASDMVQPPRVYECPVQLEAKVIEIHPFGSADSHLAGIEVQILRVHIEESLMVPHKNDYVDPDKWQPLIMNFCEFYGLSEKVYPSRLGEVYGPQKELA
ncbi:MAG: flavin reductase family protein [Chloroflexi bacterium]|nr:flavin reductase family protein [Chloroflexota bacterium]